MADITTRVDDLEVRFAFLEKQLETLDGVVRELGETAEGLRREMAALREQVAGLAADPLPPREEVPPHY